METKKVNNKTSEISQTSWCEQDFLKKNTHFNILYYDVVRR